IPRGFSPREPTFQVVLDALALTPCYLIFLITADVPEGQDFDPLHFEEDTMSFLRDLGHNGVINSLNDVVVDQMHQPWRTFAALINRSLSGKTTGLDKLHLSRAQILWGMYHKKNVDYVELLWEDVTYQIDNKEFKKQEKIIGMHTSKDDYLINTLRFISRKEASQKYGAVLADCLTNPEMKESKAYKTYLGFATGAVPPKVARKFKKASSSKKDSVPVQADEEPVQKDKRVKRAAKKSSSTPTTGIVIREPPVTTKSKGKGKEKNEELKRLSQAHPGGSGTTAKEPPSAKITPTVTSEGTGDKPGVPDVTKDDSTESESESWGNDEDDDNDEDQESSNEGSEQEHESDEQESDSKQNKEKDDDDQEEEEFDQENESEDDEMKSDEDQGMDDTTNQFDDDTDTQVEEPTKTTTGIVQGEGTDVEMTEAQQGNENLETAQEQVVEDAHVTISTVQKKTEVPVTSSSHSSNLATKYLNFLDIPHTDAEIVSPLDVPVHHEVPRTQAPTLLTIPVFVIVRI
ncbi:hypothetical protein Tco_0933511, partial [Tanacetum coccineum]